MNYNLFLGHVLVTQFEVLDVIFGYILSFIRSQFFDPRIIFEVRYKGYHYQKVAPGIRKIWHAPSDDANSLIYAQITYLRLIDFRHDGLNKLIDVLCMQTLCVQMTEKLARSSYFCSYQRSLRFRMVCPTKEWLSSFLSLNNLMDISINQTMRVSIFI